MYSGLGEGDRVHGKREQLEDKSPPLCHKRELPETETDPTVLQ